MQSVDIITAHDVVGNPTDILTVRGAGRVEDIQSVILEDTLRMAHGDMVGGQRRGALGLGTVRVYPGMELHSALMAFVDHPAQWVPARVLSLHAGEELAPRLVAALVKGVALGTHLEYYRVDTVFLQLIKLIGQRALHLFFGKTLKLSVDALYPRATELTFLRPSRHGRKAHKTT